MNDINATSPTLRPSTPVPHPPGTVVMGWSDNLPVRQSCANHPFVIVSEAVAVPYGCGFIQAARCIVCETTTAEIDADWWSHLATRSDLRYAIDAVHVEAITEYLDRQERLHPYHDRWQPYRDRNGKVVTITQDQVAAVLHAVRCVDEARAEAHERKAEGARGKGTEDYPPRLYEDFPEKSRALGRLLVDGKPLFRDVPPSALAVCDYSTWDHENGNPPWS